MREGSVSKGTILVRSNAGFNLTELLVVMLIIGILAAIIFPVFIKAKETARISECLSNMRQLGQGLTLYLDEYNSRFPSAVPWGNPNYWASPAHGSQKTFQELLSPYVRCSIVPSANGLYTNVSVFRCPSDTGIPGDDWTNGVPPNKSIWKYAGCSYEYYAANQVDWQEYDPDVTMSAQSHRWTGLSPEVQDGYSDYKRVGAPLSAIMNTTKKAVLGDTWYWHFGDEIPTEQLAYRNTLFADGHAQRVNGQEHEEARLQPLKRWHSLHEILE